MNPVYIIAENIVSPIAGTALDNFTLLKEGRSGIQQHNIPRFSPEPFFASLFPEESFVSDNVYTKFEQLLIASVSDALSLTNINPADERTGLIISSTKGNISLLETSTQNEALVKRMSLPVSAKLIAEHFKVVNKPIIVSHACISGLVALITGMRMIQSGKYDHVIVAGADIITQFILSGFQSFHAISNQACKPFDANRTGINLGEAAATIILSSQKPKGKEAIVLNGGAVSNDANHISGPSRTGEELYQVIQQSMQESGIDATEVDFISAHGTATMYNDEMEARAFNLAGLQDVPLNSLKGYYGHTLGAAGLIETVASVLSLKENVVLPTPGFDTPGTTKPVNVNRQLKQGIYNACLKTASGFGGCNAAIVLKKINI
ncbi:beta-ketoacyl synthase [Terrimonas sp.]|uniref:beta-ketoacyl-[acyl-carrier-protein] synthase family protein n=1 Tax=Terrimonas sp. TaxID=1914338 RepID=UPI000D516E0F|nr:beta-ketoacyl synthase N-terminal-like domain-containing protein [Terrimonas sp.]PVD49774.1 beta-ketoacyl synthase [Terrimonas sp.]